MATPIKDLADSAAKFVARGSTAGPEYARGVAGAGDKWQRNTTSAEANYEEGVQQAVARKAFGKGVAKAGAAKYEARATTVGQNRFGPGIREAQSAWQEGFAPFHATIGALTLSPRRPKGDPGNIDRVREVTEALRARKVGGA